MEILLMLSGFIFAAFIALLYEYKIRQIRKKLKSNMQQTNNAQKQTNNVHFYVARDKNGELWLYLSKPIRMKEEFVSYSHGKALTNHFSKYSLNENDYANLKWEDEPVEIFLNLED